MGGSRSVFDINYWGDLGKEVFTLGEAETETFNRYEYEQTQAKEEIADKRQREAEALAKAEAEKEQIFQTELSERMQTGGYRSLIGGVGTVDTARDEKSLLKGL